MNKKKLASRLKAARKKIGLSLRDVQKLSAGRVTNGYLSHLETGTMDNPQPFILHALSQVLGLDYVELLILAGHITRKHLGKSK